MKSITLIHSSLRTCYHLGIYAVSDKYIKLDRECRKEYLGLTYMGTQSRTILNAICQRWSKQVPHNHQRRSAEMFPDKTIPDAENYCRNTDEPVGIIKEPVLWCYTMNASLRYNGCTIPMCGVCFFICIPIM